MKGQTKEEILAFINNWGDETLAKAMEIKFIDIDLENETLTATMPVFRERISLSELCMAEQAVF
jgi:1,4-dihydroxy-2-naphthoyl-CoA hydrolase